MHLMINFIVKKINNQYLPKVILLLWTLFTSNILSAAQLSWTDLIKQARSSLPIQAQQQNLYASKMKLGSAYGNFWPQLSLTASQSEERKTISNMETETDYNQWSGEFSLPIFNGFSTISQVREARAINEYQSAETQSISATLRAELRQAYAEVTIGYRQLQRLEGLLKRQSSNVDILKLKYKSGREALWGYESAAAEMAATELELKSQNEKLSQAMAHLKRILNWPANKNLEIKDEVDQMLKPIDTRSLIKEQNPEFIKLDAELKQAEHSVTYFESNFYPQLNLFYRYTNTQPDPGDIIKNHEVGILLTWQLFDGLSTYYKSREARAKFVALDLEKPYKKMVLDENIKESLTNYNLALEQVPLWKKILRASELRLKTVTEQYKAGLRSYLEWEQAQEKLNQGEEKYLLAQEQALKSLAELEKLAGITLEDL